MILNVIRTEIATDCQELTKILSLLHELLKIVSPCIITNTVLMTLQKTTSQFRDQCSRPPMRFFFFTGCAEELCIRFLTLLDS